MLKNLKIRLKIVLGFGLLMVFVVFGSSLIYTNNLKIQDQAAIAIEKSKLTFDLEEKLIDHVEWSKSLLYSVINKEKFKGQLDPKKCAFGEWFYSTDRPEGVSPELWQKLEQDHKALHEEGAKIEKMIVDGVPVDEIIEHLNNFTEEKLVDVKQHIFHLVEKFKEQSNTANEELHAINSFTSLMIIIVSVLSILIALVSTYVLSKSISDPVKLVVDRINQLQNVCITNLGKGLDKMSAGDLSVKVIKQTHPLKLNRKDEMGELASITDNMILLIQGSIDSYDEVREKVKSLSAEAIELIADAKDGKLHSRGDQLAFEGEYRKIIEGFNDVLDAVIVPVQDGIDVLEHMAKGDFTPRITKSYKGDHQKIKNSINQLGDSLENILLEISDAVSATASASNQISSSAEELAAGSEEQSSQTSEVATAVEQMVATITQTTRSVVETNEAAKESGSLATEGQKVIESTIEGMKKIEIVVKNSSKIITALGDSSTQISDIIQVINDIADQTNLLALNAAIEAARAGEQGRGFAVVADEVRKLAERTTKATNEIAEMITKIQKDSQNAVVAINKGNEEVNIGMDQAIKAGESMSYIVNSSNKVLEISTQVAAASEEQSQTAEQIGRSIDGINTVAHESADGIQQVAGAATDLSRLAEQLQNLVAQFKIKSQVNNSYKNSKSNYSVRTNGTLVN